ncbi:MAG TPA: XRE family transcriptional regulator, partial [Phycisphaerales bacterium]|nr:XRE family transcriptional regulator [Phycisphaerales bacterium]
MTRSVFSRRYKVLCELLVKARVSQNFTQKDVAKSIRRPQSFVSKYENAERRLDVVEFLEVADAL